ncbi:Permease of the drug/metabolite transporter (DMT) superfamily [Tistlia consotensis]|uniref:Permease of the drug/metabolite transporter (DMT) superfamily n=1 Tax=Tistlia consotensis USBA 355 TaxID=560819 RepID=A0A1Y6BCY8_9PROT|nr:DMT family transporter [Tistlia consotensis]SME94367.1 Permease of the drug/metabolite transporter (DMT) superfamily [Tistlia consotensis USBA 355]SNR29297.1 Permease of the drug/metabolite transporter (DMT) superfamily [Tistlia consotensis]
MAVNVLFLLVLSVCWSVGYLFIADSDHGLPPLAGTAVMCSLAAVFLLAAVAALRRPLLATLRQRPLALAAMGLSAIALPQLSDVYGQTEMGPDVAALVGTVVPVFTFLLTAFVLRSRPYSNRRGLGVATALGGLAIFLLWDGVDGALSSVRGAMIMASGGLVFAINGVVTERITRTLDPLAVGAWAVAFGALWMIALALGIEGPPESLPSQLALLGAVGDGLVSIGFAFLLYYLLLGRAGADFAALYAYIVPMLGVLLAVVAGDKAPSAGHLLGLAVVMLGVWLLVGGRRPTPQRRAAAAE